MCSTTSQNAFVFYKNMDFSKIKVYKKKTKKKRYTVIMLDTVSSIQIHLK